jgi:hypothetical protein
MLKFCRHTAVILTVLAFTSFTAAFAQNAPAALRDNPAWTAADGVLTTTVPATDPNAYLGTRAAFADSVTSLEYRAPAGAKATLYLQGRYAVELAGNGEWTPVTVRFRAPRFDEGFTKSDNAVVL